MHRVHTRESIVWWTHSIKSCHSNCNHIKFKWISLFAVFFYVCFIRDVRIMFVDLVWWAVVSSISFQWSPPFFGWLHSATSKAVSTRLIQRNDTSINIPGSICSKHTHTSKYIVFFIHFSNHLAHSMSHTRSSILTRLLTLQFQYLLNDFIGVELSTGSCRAHVLPSNQIIMYMYNFGMKWLETRFNLIIHVEFEMKRKFLNTHCWVLQWRRPRARSVNSTSQWHLQFYIDNNNHNLHSKALNWWHVCYIHTLTSAQCYDSMSNLLYNIVYSTE